ncbi:hypothetical protein MMC13_008202 [Lambiella insularis]|nr:hypothetical protein [Lambiella insularis]
MLSHKPLPPVLPGYPVEIPTHNEKSNVQDLLIKVIYFVHQAHDAVRSKSAKAAKQLAKVSNDVLEIGMMLSEIVEVEEAVHGDLQKDSTISQLPTVTYPPGLFRNVEEARSHAENKNAKKLLDGLMAEIGSNSSSPRALDHLEPKLEEAVAETFENAFNDFGQARFVCMTSFEPVAAAKLAQNFLRLREQIRAWDKDFVETSRLKRLPLPLVSDIPPSTIGSLTLASAQLLEDSMPLSLSIDKPPSSPANFPEKALSGRPPDDKASTWAKIAAIPPTPNDVNISRPTINLVTNLSTAQSQKAVMRMIVPSDCVNPDMSEVEREIHRVIFVRGCKKSIKLSDITAHITEGPIMSVSIDEDHTCPEVSACVIFMEAKHGHDFVERVTAKQRETGKCLYGHGSEVLIGGPWPQDDEIRAMVYKRERRRLTFSCGGLFNRISRETFKADVDAIAGELNVELIWVFNTGNATVVLASVRVVNSKYCLATANLS